MRCEPFQVDSVVVRCIYEDNTFNWTNAAEVFSYLPVFLWPSKYMGMAECERNNEILDLPG